MVDRTAQTLHWWEWLAPPVLVCFGFARAWSDDWGWTRFWPMVILAGAAVMILVGRRYHAAKGRH